MSSGGTSLSRTLEIGEGRFAHASGGLWLSEERTLLLADVHLGYGWALRRRGQLGPVHEVKVQEKLGAAVAELAPQKIVFLGDAVHAPKPAPVERASVEQTFLALARTAEIIVVRGNHDRAFNRDFGALGVAVVESWAGKGVMAVHGDRPFRSTSDHLIVGHAHPALAIVDDAGASQRVPVFLASPRLTVVPAFSPLAAGLNIGLRLPPELRPHLPLEVTSVIAASGKRVVRLGTLLQVRRTYSRHATPR